MFGKFIEGNMTDNRKTSYSQHLICGGKANSADRRKIEKAPKPGRLNNRQNFTYYQIQPAF